MLKSQGIKDSSGIDSVQIQARILQYTANTTLINHTLLTKTITSINSTNPMNILAFVPGVTRGQEMSSGLSIKGGNMYASNLYIDGFKVKNISHNIGFFHSINTDAIETIEVHDGLVPSFYNSGGSIFAFNTINTFVKDPNIKLNLSPFNANINGTCKLQKDLGIHLNFTTSILDKLDATNPYGLFNAYHDFHIKSDIRLKKINAIANLQILSINEKQNFTNSLGLLNGFQGEFQQQHYLLNIKSDSEAKLKIPYSLRIQYAPMNNQINQLARTLSIKEYNYNGILELKLSKSFSIGAEWDKIQSKLIDSSLNFKISNNTAALFTAFKHKYKKWTYNADFRINHIIINDRSTIIPLMRLGLSHQSQFGGFHLTFNQFSPNYFGLSNSIIPSFQDLRIPVYNVANQAMQNELNLKYIYYKKQFGIQVLATISKTSNTADKNINEILSFDLDKLKFGYSNYRAVGTALSWRNKQNEINVNLTLSKSKTTINALNQGLSYNSNQDRPFVFNILYNRYVRKLSVSVQYTFQSGRPFTAPTGYIYPFVLAWSNKNEFRTRPFHHLDLGIKLIDRKIGKWINHVLSVHAYNVYARRNVYNVIFIDNKPQEISLFPFLLSIEYKVKIQ